LSLELEKLRLEIKREENIKRVLEEAIIHESLLKKWPRTEFTLSMENPAHFAEPCNILTPSARR